MAFDKTDTGTLSENGFKQSDKQPDMTGRIETLSPEVRQAIAEGKPVRLAGWWKDGRDGKWLSLRVSLPQEKPAGETRKTIPGEVDWRKLEQREQATQKPAPVAAGTEEFDDDIPF